MGIQSQAIQMDSHKEPQPEMVIHPRDDVPEEKVRSEGLGRIYLTSGARWSLLALRGRLAVEVSRLLVRGAAWMATLLSGTEHPADSAQRRAGQGARDPGAQPPPGSVAQLAAQVPSWASSRSSTRVTSPRRDLTHTDREAQKVRGGRPQDH